MLPLLYRCCTAAALARLTHYGDQFDKNILANNDDPVSGTIIQSYSYVSNHTAFTL